MIRRLIAPLLLTLAVLSPLLPAAPEGGRKVALVVGINRYDGLTELAYAVNDATELAKVLRSPGCRFDEVVLLTSDGATAPTAANLRAALEKVLKGRKRADTVLVALAGHGVQVEVRDPEGEGDPRRYPFFCPSDADSGTVKYRTGHSATMLNLDHLFDDVGRCNAGVKLVLVDACRNELKVVGRTRSLAEAKVTVPDGVQALFSCGRRQVAYELDALKHGLFFYHVIHGLKGRAINDEGAVTWASLTGYASRNVARDAKRLMGREQSPTATGYYEGETPVLVANAPGGEAERLYQRGMDYSLGRGVIIDNQQSVRHLTGASERGHPLATAALAAAYASGRGVPRSTERGHELAKSVVPALKNLADTPTSNPDAPYWLGWAYAHGQGVGKDEAEAVRWYRKAAAQGQVMALNNLGVCYTRGHGVARDPAEAVRWYRRAAEQNYATAQANLGWMYAYGEGVAKDEAEAFQLYRKAAAQGLAMAQNNLGVCYAWGQGVAKDEAEAVRWYRKAAEQNYLTAQFNMGVMYASGRGVAKDEAEAARWYGKAAAQGHKGAINVLKTKGKSGPPSPSMIGD